MGYLRSSFGSLSLWRKIVWMAKLLPSMLIGGSVLGLVFLAIGEAIGFRELSFIGFIGGLLLTRFYFEPQIEEEVRKKQLRKQLREEERDAQLLQEIREEEQND